MPKGDLPVTPSGAIGSTDVFAGHRRIGRGAPPGNTRSGSRHRQFQAVGKVRKPQFPVRYNDEDSSGVVVTVRAETNQLEPILLK